jgi:hypothetical protein
VTDASVALVEGVLSTPRGLLALAAVAAIEGFFPALAPPASGSPRSRVATALHAKGDRPVAG